MYKSFLANGLFGGTVPGRKRPGFSTFRLRLLANYGATCHAVHRVVEVELAPPPPNTPIITRGAVMPHFEATRRRGELTDALPLFCFLKKPLANDVKRA